MKSWLWLVILIVAFPASGRRYLIPRNRMVVPETATPTLKYVYEDKLVDIGGSLHVQTRNGPVPLFIGNDGIIRPYSRYFRGNPLQVDAWAKAYYRSLQGTAQGAEIEKRIQQASPVGGSKLLSRIKTNDETPAQPTSNGANSPAAGAKGIGNHNQSGGRPVADGNQTPPPPREESLTLEAFKEILERSPSDRGIVIAKAYCSALGRRIADWTGFGFAKTGINGEGNLGTDIVGLDWLGREADHSVKNSPANRARVQNGHRIFEKQINGTNELVMEIPQSWEPRIRTYTIKKRGNDLRACDDIDPPSCCDVYISEPSPADPDSKATEELAETKANFEKGGTPDFAQVGATVDTNVLLDAPFSCQREGHPQDRITRKFSLGLNSERPRFSRPNNEIGGQLVFPELAPLADGSFGISMDSKFGTMTQRERFQLKGSAQDPREILLKWEVSAPKGPTTGEKIVWFCKPNFLPPINPSPGEAPEFDEGRVVGIIRQLPEAGVSKDDPRAKIIIETPNGQQRIINPSNFGLPVLTGNYPGSTKVPKGQYVADSELRVGDRVNLEVRRGPNGQEMLFKGSQSNWLIEGSQERMTDAKRWQGIANRQVEEVSGLKDPAEIRAQYKSLLSEESSLLLPSHWEKLDAFTKTLPEAERPAFTSAHRYDVPKDYLGLTAADTFSKTEAKIEVVEGGGNIEALRTEIIPLLSSKELKDQSPAKHQMKRVVDLLSKKRLALVVKDGSRPDRDTLTNPELNSEMEQTNAVLALAADSFTPFAEEEPAFILSVARRAPTVPVIRLLATAAKKATDPAKADICSWATTQIEKGPSEEKRSLLVTICGN